MTTRSKTVLKSVQFHNGGSILHGGALLGKKIVRGAAVGSSGKVKCLTLDESSKIVEITLADGEVYLLDLSSVAVCVESKKKEEFKKYEKKQKQEIQTQESTKLEA